jgi:hypothetical protein
MGMVIGGVLSWARTIGISIVALKIAAAMGRDSDGDGGIFDTEGTEITEGMEKRNPNESSWLRLMAVLLLFRRGEIFYALHHFFVVLVG